MNPETYRLMRQLEDEHWWFVARRQILSNLIASLNAGTQCKVLELGCGTGGNLEMLGRFGDVVGVELDEAAAELARGREQSPVFEGGLPDDLPALESQFDLVCLFDVIEHVEQDAASLERVKELLSPKGAVVLTVPAFPFLWSRHDDENQHFRRYRKKDIRQLATVCGMQVTYCSYFNFWLFPPVAAVRLFRKLVPYKESWKDMKKPRQLLNRLLRAVFASERHVVGRWAFPFGISLVAVLKKSANTR